MPSKATREWLYAEIEDVISAVSEKQHNKWLAGNFEDSAWLAAAEDALQRYMEDHLDDEIEDEEERRWDRANERAFEGPSGEEEMWHLQAEARKLK